MGKGTFFQKVSFPHEKYKIKKFAIKKVNRLFFAYIIYVDFHENEKREDI